MAKDKDTTTKSPINFDAYLPAGYDKSGLKEVGGLRPIVPAELQYDQGVVVAGHIVALHDMPERPAINSKNGEKEPWQAILIHLTAPTKAQLGEDIKDVKAGDYVYIPVNGNLRNNADLLNAAVDKDRVHFGIFAVTEQVPMGKGKNDMWSYKVMIHDKTIARDGAYALSSNRSPTRALQAGRDFDPATGELRGGAAAQA